MDNVRSLNNTIDIYFVLQVLHDEITISGPCPHRPDFGNTAISIDLESRSFSCIACREYGSIHRLVQHLATTEAP